MKRTYVVTRIQDDGAEKYEMKNYYQVLHFIIDLVVFGMGEKSIILKIEVNEENEGSLDKNEG